MKGSKVQKDNSAVKQRAVFNLAWRFAERCSAQGVEFVVSIVLARLLAPSDYGTIALVTVITNILQIFVDSGFGNALIQKKDADDADFSSVFYFNMFFCFLLYICMYLSAPFISNFYKDMTLIPVIRVLSLTIIISGLKNVQQAYVSRNLIFKKFFFATLGGTIGAAILGIGLAYSGYGVWALAAQQIFNTAIDTLMLWITVKWRPKKIFSLTRLKELFSYGGRIMLAALVDAFYKDVRQLIIGRIYSPTDLAYYNKGRQFPGVFVSNINASIDSVLFPILSERQNDRERVRAMTRHAIRTSSYLMWPFMLILAAVGEPLIRALLTQKWIACLPFLYIFCFVKGMEPIHTANLNAIKAMGKSEFFLRMEIIKKSVGILIVFVTMKFGVLAIGLGSVVYTLFASVINSYPNRKLLGYTYFEQIKDITPSLLLAIGMGITVHGICFLHMNDMVTVLAGGILGMLIYFGSSFLLKMDEAYLLLNILENFKKRR